MQQKKWKRAEVLPDVAALSEQGSINQMRHWSKAARTF
jgi:hypothetical protein